MIKPKPLGLLATKEELKNNLALEKQYKEELITKLLIEQQSKSLDELVIKLAEKFHPKYKIKEKRGAKVKWSSYLKALLSLEIKNLQNSGASRKVAIHRLLDKSSWSKLTKNSIDPFELLSGMDKEGKKTPFYQALEKSYAYSVLKKDTDSWKEMVETSIREALVK
jgi:hypothetical protein